MVATKCTSNPYLLGQECGISHLYIHEVPTKHPREIFLDLQNANEKKLYPQNLTRKNFGPTKYPREEISDPRNNLEKKFGPTKYPRKKNFKLTKYKLEKIQKPRNTHKKVILHYHAITK